MIDIKAVRALSVQTPMLKTEGGWVARNFLKAGAGTVLSGSGEYPGARCASLMDASRCHRGLRRGYLRVVLLRSAHAPARIHESLEES
jgi:hypothetical protein